MKKRGSNYGDFDTRLDTNFVLDYVYLDKVLRCVKYLSTHRLLVHGSTWSLDSKYRLRPATPNRR